MYPILQNIRSARAPVCIEHRPAVCGSYRCLRWNARRTVTGGLTALFRLEPIGSYGRPTRESHPPFRRGDHASAVRDDGGGLEPVYQHQPLSMEKRSRCAVELWNAGRTAGTPKLSRLRIGEVARLGVTNDVLCNWERNGLLDVPRQESNTYRLYASGSVPR